MQAVVDTFGSADLHTGKRPVIWRSPSGDPLEPELRHRRPGLPVVGKGVACRGNESVDTAPKRHR